MAKIIDGKLIAEQIREDLKKKVAGRKVGLAVVLVGEDPASHIYVNAKIKACQQVGIESSSYILSKDVAKSELVELIKKLNKDKSVHGILVQLPLPKHLSAREILGLIDPQKDVDGFHVQNSGALFLGEEGIFACTPAGVMELIKSTGVKLPGKHAVVIGRSNIVGKPTAMMLLNADCTVTVCHSATKNLADITRQADILVVAIGCREFIKGNMIKKGAIVIDVGINRYDDRLYGDVAFNECDHVGWITPVPGGVGPMTIAMLLSNTVRAAGV